MDNPHPPGNRPLAVAPDPGRDRTTSPDPSSGRRHPLADVLAAVMLLLATLSYLGRLVWGLSQPGYEIQARDFGSLLAAIIAIPAGVLLVTGVKPAVARITGALGAGAMLLFNAVNLAGGSVDDVIGKYGTWAAIPIVVTTVIAIIALYRASWSAGEQSVTPDRESVADGAQEFVSHPHQQESVPPPIGGFAAQGAGPVDETAAGVVAAPEPGGAGVIAPRMAQLSPFTAPPAPPEPAVPDPSLPEPEASGPEVAETASSEQEFVPAASRVPMAPPDLPHRPVAAPPAAGQPQPPPTRPERSPGEIPEMSMPEAAPHTGPVEVSPAGRPEPDAAVSDPAGPAAQPSPEPDATSPVPQAYVPERLAPHPSGPAPAVPEAPQPQHDPFAAAQASPTEPFAQQDSALSHTETDGIPAIDPADPPTAVLPRIDFTANAQQSGPAGDTAYPGAQPAGGVPTPPPFAPPGQDPNHPGQHPIAADGPGPETAPLQTGGPDAPSAPESPRPQDNPAPGRNEFGDRVPPQHPGNPPQNNAPVHPQYNPAPSMPHHPPAGAQQHPPRLPGTEPVAAHHVPRQPVLRQPGGFLAPPPVDPQPTPNRQQPGPGHPHPDAGRAGLQDVSVSEHPAPPDRQPPHTQEPPPAHLDHRQAPPKRLAPSPWAQDRAQEQ